MSTRSTRWLLFAVSALALPLPAIGPFGGLVPPVHHVVLFAATSAIAAIEGVAGPVGRILLLFAINAVATSIACGLAAWLLARLIARLPERARSAVAWGLAAALLGASLVFPLYQTPFGRAPTANLLGLF